VGVVPATAIGGRFRDRSGGPWTAFSRPRSGARAFVVHGRASDLLALRTRPVPPEATPTARWGHRPDSSMPRLVSFFPSPDPSNPGNVAVPAGRYQTPRLHPDLSPGLATTGPFSSNRRARLLALWVGVPAFLGMVPRRPWPGLRAGSGSRRWWATGGPEPARWNASYSAFRSEAKRLAAAVHAETACDCPPRSC